MAATTTTVRICKSKYTDPETLELVECGSKLKDSLCPDRARHVMKYKTGFCGIGLCEGTKPKSFTGKPMKTCPMYLTCPCSCHKQLHMLYKLSEMPRQLVENPEWQPEPRTFWMPSDDPSWDIAHSSSPSESTAPVIIESPAPDRVPATVARSFGTTATGRAARGQLEYWVKEMCDVWLIETYESPCTPAWISSEIARKEAIDPPSVGAINAVFERWVKLGFALVEKKPTRFIKYTDEGLQLGLDAMKARSKRKAKLEQAHKNRNLIR